MKKIEGLVVVEGVRVQEGRTNYYNQWSAEPPRGRVGVDWEGQRAWARARATETVRVRDGVRLPKDQAAVLQFAVGQGLEGWSFRRGM